MSRDYLERGECADFLTMPVAMEARTSDGLLSLVLMGEATSASPHWGVEGSFSLHTESPYEDLVAGLPAFEEVMSPGEMPPYDPASVLMSVTAYPDSTSAGDIYVSWSGEADDTGMFRNQLQTRFLTWGHYQTR